MTFYCVFEKRLKGIDFRLDSFLSKNEAEKIASRYNKTGDHSYYVRKLGVQEFPY